jgi:predicted DNA-binding protein (MmcQ/YjbR family)
MPEAASRARFRALFEYCASRPGGVAARRWGETVFAVRGRTYAFLGAPEAPAVTVRATAASRDLLLEHPAVERARYVGRFGWVTVRVTDAGSLELAFELIDRSHAIAAQE